jgi:hypothetical protein
MLQQMNSTVVKNHQVPVYDISNDGPWLIRR